MRQVVLYTAFGTTRYNFMKAVAALEQEGSLIEIPGGFYDSTVVLDPEDESSTRILETDLLQKDRNRIYVIDGFAFYRSLPHLRDAPNLYVVVTCPNNEKPFVASSVKEAQMKLAPFLFSS